MRDTRGASWPRLARPSVFVLPGGVPCQRVVCAQTPATRCRTAVTLHTSHARTHARTHARHAERGCTVKACTHRSGQTPVVSPTTREANVACVCARLCALSWCAAEEAASSSSMTDAAAEADAAERCHRLFSCMCARPCVCVYMCAASRCVRS